MPLPIQKVVNAQRDFSGGQIDIELKRDDTSAVLKAGARQCENFRVLNSKNLRNRPGRSIKYLQVQTGRVDQVRLSPTLVVDVLFGGDGALAICDINGAVLASAPAASYPWRIGNVDVIIWTLVNLDAADRDIVITFPGMQPQIIRFTAPSTWQFLSFSFSPNSQGGVLAPFYRLAASGISLTPSAVSNAITLVASSAVFAPAMVGTYLRWLGSQILITGYTSPTVVNGTVQQPLPYTVHVSIGVAGSGVTGYFSVGDVVQGSVSGFKGEIVAFNTLTGEIDVNMLKSGVIFTAGTGGSIAGDTIVGPTGVMTPSTVHPLVVTTVSPGPSIQWDELAFGDYRGWPTSCFFDQGRLGFTDLPGIPRGIAWTAFNTFYNFLVGANPTDAMFELMSETARIRNVVPGDGGELVFTDVGVWYIPINEQSPLKPGSVVFKPISPEPSSAVRPVRIAEGVIYVSAGLNRLILIAGTGATYSVKPYGTRDISMNHAQLFQSIKCIAVTTGDGDYAERYIYTLDSSGGINVGRLEISTDTIGWLPWSGIGSVNWLSALQSVVTFSTSYTVSLAILLSAVERLDVGQFLDAAVYVNSLPPGLTPPGGKGPLYFWAGGSVRLIDLSTRDMGVYQVDANGFIIPQFQGAENLTSPLLIAGQAWTSTFEPFVPAAQPGSDVLQRMRKRRVAKASIYVQQSNGFIWGKRRIGPYVQGDNQEIAPPMREQTYDFRQTGRDNDPRILLVKDTPGPLTILEIAMEVTA
jgi:hypothetical protein